MPAEKEDKIDFRGPEKSKKVKCAALLTVTLVTVLAAAAILIVAVWPGPKVSKSLVEVNLEEGDTLMYRVDQRFEVKEKDTQKETISSIVGIQVVNKTSDAYWFLLKINTTFKGEDKKVKSAIAGYFRVRLPRGDDYNKEAGRNETTESFELHGDPETDVEFVRFLHGLLYQLLPAVRRDLYEDVDRQTDKNVKPENSPLFPGPVRMHRQANTKQGGDVMVKNHFNQSDLVNSSSDMDLDVKYTDSAAINKSNGMVSESNVSLSELLHFGEPIKTKDGNDVTMMKVSLYSHVTRIEVDSDFFLEEEIKAVKTVLFVRLVLPTTQTSMNETGGQRLSTQEPTTVIRRNRRAAEHHSNLYRTSTPHPGGGGGGGGGGRRRTVVFIPTQAIRPGKHKFGRRPHAIEKTFSLFNKKFLGIRTQADGKVWLKYTGIGNATKRWELGNDLRLTIGRKGITVYQVKYSIEQLERGIGKERSFSWRKGIPFCFKALFINFCVEFSLAARLNIKPPKLVAHETSLSPPKIAVQIESSGDVTASVEAYATVLLVRGGVFADGTIVRATVPTKLSYSSVKPANQQWCLASDNVQLTALELHAGLFYQWKKCRWLLFGCRWGPRNTFLSFGRWAAVRKTLKLFEICF